MKLRNTAAALIAVAFAATLGACDLIRIEERRGAFWEAFVFGPAVDEVERFHTLEQMLVASDAVITARVRDVAISRILGAEPGENGIAYIRVELDVDHVIAGQAPASVPVEFIAFGAPDGGAVLVERLKRQLPVDSAVVFLHAKRGANEAGLYRVTSSTGLWAPTARSRLDSPLRMDTPEASGLFAAELAGITDLAGLVALLADYAQETSRAVSAELAESDAAAGARTTSVARSGRPGATSG